MIRAREEPFQRCRAKARKENCSDEEAMDHVGDIWGGDDGHCLGQCRTGSAVEVDVAVIRARQGQYLETAAYGESQLDIVVIRGRQGLTFETAKDSSPDNSTWQ